MTSNNIISLSSIHFNISVAAFPAELAEQPQDEGSKAAEFSFLLAPCPRQSQLKWVPLSDTVQEGTGLKVICAFLMDKN